MIGFFAFRYVKYLGVPSISPWSFSIAFTVKVMVGLIFLYIYTDVYGDGALSADASIFMAESKIVNDIFYSSPIDYLKLLFGFGNQNDLLNIYLQETTHWDAGSQTLINDNRNIIRVHSLIHFFSYNNPINHVLIACVISTIALKQLFLGFSERSSLPKSNLFLMLLLLPSLLFWTSGVLKEPFMLLGLSLIIRGLFKNESFRIRWFYSILGSFILLGFKPYILLALVPGIVFFLIYKFISGQRIIVSIAILFSIVTASLVVFSSSRDKAVHLLSRKQFDFKNVGKGGVHVDTKSNFYFFENHQLDNLVLIGDSALLIKETDALILKHGSIDKPIPVHLKPNGEKWLVYFSNTKSDGYIDVTLINDSFSQLLKNIPEALVNSLLRPMLFDNGSWLKYPAMIETILIFIFLGFSIKKRKSISKNQWATIIAIALFILTLALLIGWVTPVLGAIVRYRIPCYIGILLMASIMIGSLRENNSKPL